MILKQEMMGLLVSVCPSFAPQWNAFLDEWKDEEVELPLYVCLADFARHLIKMLEQGEADSFKTIFEVIERLHVEGEHYVQEAATVGLLEDLQNTNLHHSTDPEQFCKYLGPVSEKWWNKLIRFWEHGEPLSEDQPYS